MQWLVFRHCTMSFGQQLLYTNMVSVLLCGRTVAFIIKPKDSNEKI